MSLLVVATRRIRDLVLEDPAAWLIPPASLAGTALGAVLLAIRF